MPSEKRLSMTVRISPEKHKAVEAKLVETGVRKFQALAECFLDEWLGGKRVVEMRHTPQTQFPEDFARLSTILQHGTQRQRDTVRSMLKELSSGISPSRLRAIRSQSK